MARQIKASLLTVIRIHCENRFFNVMFFELRAWNGQQHLRKFRAAALKEEKLKKQKLKKKNTRRRINDVEEKGKKRKEEVKQKNDYEEEELKK